MLYLHLVSLESDLPFSESYDIHSNQGPSPQHITRAWPLLGRARHLLQLPGPAAVQVRNLWCVVGTVFYNLCVTNSRDFILRMANIIDYLSDGLYEEDMDTEPPRGIVDIPSSRVRG